MDQMTVNEILTATKGKLYGHDAPDFVTGISTDSRKIQPGDIFIPLIGENFDGHDFIADAFEKGAAAALTQREGIHFPGKTLIIVSDTLKALQNLASWYRSQFDIPFAAVTGSVGKTSTKEMLACVLGTRYNVLKNEGNFNNEIGVPLTLFKLDRSHEAAVIEMGMSGFGEIGALSAIVAPKVGIITNIGISHIEKLGSRQNIVKAKLELLNGLKPDGLLILNGDDVMLGGLKALLDRRVVTYGLEEDLDYRAYNIQSLGRDGTAFNVVVGGNEYTVRLPAPGVHSVYNALAALAAGCELDVPMPDIIDGIAHFRAGDMRLNIINAKGFTVINDAYNASPQSVAAAIVVLRDLDAVRRFVVLGDMLELGDWSVKAHTETGATAAAMKPDFIVTVGRQAANIAKGAVDAGFDARRVMVLQNNSQALKYLQEHLVEGDAVLVKGSRGMKMEEIVVALTEEA